MIARDYQTEAVAAVSDCLSEHPSSLIVLPTGMGKTIVMAMLAGMASKRVMVIAHREELIHQNADKIARFTGHTVDIEMGDLRANEGLMGHAKIVVASKDSLHRARINRFNPDDFSLLMIDECHHAPAKTYARVIEHFANAKVVGVTATPDRADEMAMGKVFASVAFDMSIKDGIERGWLVPVRQRKIACESLDFSGVNKVGADFNQGQLATLLEMEGPLHEMTNPTIEFACGVPLNTLDDLQTSDPETAPERFRAMLGERKRTLIFCSRVHHAGLVVHIINRWLPGSAEMVHGETPPDERSDLFKRFGNGSIQFLANVGIATEGWDDPALDGKGVQIVSLMRPTQSRSLYAQMIGRGTRPLPGLVDALAQAGEKARTDAITESPKPHILILDFHDLADSHSLIHAEDVLGGTYDDAVVARAKAKKKSGGGGEEGDDVLGLLDEAEKEHAEEQRKKIRAGVRSHSQEIDPFARVGRRRKRVPFWFEGRPVSDKQKALLERRGLWNPEVVTNMGIASQLLDAPSPKQQSVLKRSGYTDAEIGKMNGKTVSATIDALASNGWKRPK